MSISRTRAPRRTALQKTPTGIAGLDTITGGGLPTGRPTLICGAAGCGKTLFAIAFLAAGITEYDEPGALITFEERTSEIAENVASLGIDIDRFVAEKSLAVDYVHVDTSEIEETGEYDLEGLFVRLGHAIDSVGAKRVVLDTIEVLFAGLKNEAVLRSELRRLFTWLKDRGVTAIVTGERGTGSLTRHGLEEYVSDCVILLDNRVANELSTRRLRILKYRGSAHGSNEYPFLIDEKGISVLPVTAISLKHAASSERVSTGVAEVDEMLGGGYYRGASVFVSGSAGTGKSSLAAHFADASCRRGEKCLYFSFEESPDQVVRNMRSIGIDLTKWLKKRLLDFHSVRPTLYGLETHLASFQRAIDEFQPRSIVFDPLSSLLTMGSPQEVRSALLRVVDLVKSAGITGVFTSLFETGSTDQSELGVSSLMDTWLTVRDIEHGGERNRGLYVIKSRGMAHSNQIREFLITANGVRLQQAYVGSAGVLTGSARVAQEALEEEQAVERAHAFEREQRELVRRKALAEAQIQALRAEAETAEADLARLAAAEAARQKKERADRERMAISRKVGGVGKK